MPRWLRPLVLCLVAFALPWQAVAASAIGLCQSHGDRAGSAAAAGHGGHEAAAARIGHDAQAVHAAHAAHATHAAHHAAMQADAPAHHDTVLPSVDASGTHPAAGASSCPFCAACGAASTLPPAASAGPALPAPEGGWAAAPARRVAGIVAPAPERPPRLPAV